MNTRRKKFFKYVVPSVGAMVVMALYIVVDGIFVGRGVGESALASVNIAIPFTTFIIAVAMMITMGGAAVTSIRMGRGDQAQANESFVTSGFMVLTFSIVVSAIGIIFPGGIARLAGASAMLETGTAIYIRYFSMFAVFACMSMAMSAFVRNDGNPNLALWGMIAGAVSNVILDWVFIFPLQMGIKGAAIASGLGQLISLLVLSVHFIRRHGKLRFRKTRLSLSLIGKIVKRGLPELITQMSQPVTILCYNLVVINTLGEIGVSAFSVICYLLTLILGVFMGVSQGVQPLISRSFGEKDVVSEKYYFRAGVIANVGLSVAVYLVLMFFGKSIIAIFNPNTQLISIAHEAAKMYGLSFVLAAANIICVTYFLSTKRTRQALIISASRSVGFNIILIPLIPHLLGASAIWYGIVAAELITMMIAAGIVLWHGTAQNKALVGANP